MTAVPPEMLSVSPLKKFSHGLVALILASAWPLPVGGVLPVQLPLLASALPASACASAPPASAMEPPASGVFTLASGSSFASGDGTSGAALLPHAAVHSTQSNAAARLTGPSIPRPDRVCEFGDHRRRTRSRCRDQGAVHARCSSTVNTD